MKKFIFKSAFAMAFALGASMPASASWNCFTDGTGCWEVADGTCATRGKQLSARGIDCIGPVNLGSEREVVAQSWQCFTGGQGCYEVPDGACRTNSHHHVEQGMRCYGPVKDVQAVSADAIAKAILLSGRDGAAEAAEAYKKAAMPAAKAMRVKPVQMETAPVPRRIGQ